MVLERFTRVARLSWRERARLVEACLFLTSARVLVRLVPLKLLGTRLGHLHQQSSFVFDTDRQRRQAQEVGWSVTTMGRHLPWKSPCLDQAVAGKLMLKRRGLASTVYLGLAHDERAGLIAHAWLRCGELILTGRSQYRRFTVVGSFAETTPVEADSAP